MSKLLTGNASTTGANVSLDLDQRYLHWSPSVKPRPCSFFNLSVDALRALSPPLATLPFRNPSVSPNLPGSSTGSPRSGSDKMGASLGRSAGMGSVPASLGSIVAFERCSGKSLARIPLVGVTVPCFVRHSASVRDSGVAPVECIWTEK